MHFDKHALNSNAFDGQNIKQNNYKFVLIKKIARSRLNNDLSGTEASKNYPKNAIKIKSSPSIKWKCAAIEISECWRA